MCADEANRHRLLSVVNRRNETILVALDVEHEAAAAKYTNIGCLEANVMRRPPTGSFNTAPPTSDSFRGIAPSSHELIEDFCVSNLHDSYPNTPD